MSFKQAFEKNMNKELEDDHRDPPPPIDIEMQHGPPPVHTFPSYPPPPPRSGMYVPTPLFALFIVLFLFESGILFVYTVVALWNTLPGSMTPVVMPPACNCAAAPPIMIAPNGWAPSAASTVTQTADHSITITVTASASASASTTSTSTTSTSSTSSTKSSSTDSSNTSSSAISGATQSALAGLLGALAGKQDPTTSSDVVTVTAPVPTMTVLSTATAELPSITTMTVLSTASPPVVQSTVTSISISTAGS